jgi:glutathione S-transferase
MIRVALLETGLASRVEMREVTLRDPQSGLLPFNPVGRVPTLQLDDGTVLTESLLILSHLDAIQAGTPLLPRDGSDKWRTLAEMGTAIGLLEGIVTWARMLRNPEHERARAVIALETTRVNRTADTLEKAVARGAYEGPAINAAHIALVCALGWIEPRHPAWIWREGRPLLSAWFDAIAATPSFLATAPPPL